MKKPTRRYIKDYDCLTIEEAIDRFDSRIKMICKDPIMTGIERLDTFFRGWLPGELCVVGSCPDGEWISFLQTVMASNLRKNVPMAYIGISNPHTPQFLARIVSLTYNATKECESKRYLDILDSYDIKSLPLYLGCRQCITVSYIKEQCTKLVQAKGVRCVIIENLQTIFFAEKSINGRKSKGKILKELKRMAIKLNICLIINSEMNQYRNTSPYDFSPRHPQIIDFSDASVVETYADSIIILYRPVFYRLFTDDYGNNLKDKLTIITAKHLFDLTSEVNVKVTANGALENITNDYSPSFYTTILEDDENLQSLVDAFGLELHEIYPPV